MRVAIILCILCLCHLCNLFSQTTEEENAIVTFLTESYQAAIDRNWDKYINTWAHNKTTSRIGISGPDIWEINGWDNILKYYQNAFKENPEPDKIQFEYRNFTILIQDDMAWAAFDKYVKTGDEMKKRTREYRRLVKQDGEWKIIVLMHVSQPQKEE